MPDIVLATLNAKYIHAAFGLRYLLANLGPLAARAAIAEFDIQQRPIDIVENLLAREPKLIGFGVYIWNVTPTTEVVAMIKRLRPDLLIVVGGPEVSYETDGQLIVGLVDYVIAGEGDLAFADLCGRLLGGDRPSRKIIAADPPALSDLRLPYELYDAQDIAHRVLYVEASRGCPFSCEFCLSSLDIPIRQVALSRLLEALANLLERGATQLKFVDRTFNLSVATSRAILEFLLDRFQPGHFFHFEMVPDRLPDSLREVIARFPPGALQFEVGIQTFNPQVADRIQRRQDLRRVEDNFRFLRASTGVHVHADLIAGLPGEDLDSFAAGFDRLVALNPQEIQVGILKRLRGVPIIRHGAEWEMVYSPQPPYEILRTRSLGFAALQNLRRFARYWDLVGNSGNFVETCRLIWSDAKAASSDATASQAVVSPFRAFMRWTQWLHARVGRTDSIALIRLMQLLFEFLIMEQRLDPIGVAEAMWRDYQRGGRRDKPSFLKDYLPSRPTPASQTNAKSPATIPKRQARHLALGHAGSGA